MRAMWIYAIIPVAYVILFVSARGGFLKASRYLNRTLLSRLAIDDASVRTALVVVFCANAAAALLTLSGRLNSTAEEGYLLRQDHNGYTYTENLEVSISGEQKPV